MVYLSFSVTYVEGNVSQLIEEDGQVLGVVYKEKDGGETKVCNLMNCTV